MRAARDRELLETHIRNAQRIVEGSAQLRGAFLKLIQMLSMRHDLLPGEALDVLKATQSSVPPMSYPMISEQIRKELGAQAGAAFSQLRSDRVRGRIARAGASREAERRTRRRG